jgi:hypothetical protein
MAFACQRVSYLVPIYAVPGTKTTVVQPRVSKQQTMFERSLAELKEEWIEPKQGRSGLVRKEMSEMQVQGVTVSVSDLSRSKAFCYRLHCLSSVWPN